ncbi:MAG: FAD-dependent oxidoreductase [Caldilineaceae bacterium]
MHHRPHIIIFGAGPAGLGAAYQLGRRQLAQVTVLERHSVVGGNAGSFKVANLHVDYGSHRLHPSCDDRVLKDIQLLLGDDLLRRPRHGRIRIRGRWVHFPLKAMNLALNLPVDFIAGVTTDFLQKHLRRNGSECGEQENFASVLRAGLGNTICRDFYFPYAQKIWGVEPAALSVTQAYRRISASSLSKMVGKVFPFLRSSRQTGGKYFFYPRYGFGQISDALCREAEKTGVIIQRNATVKSVQVTEKQRVVTFAQNGQTRQLEADQIWSTIPITALAQRLKPSPPQEYLSAISQINYRGMILIYLVLEQKRFTEYDAHYFPELDIPITRLSEPKNYGEHEVSSDHTVLCAELPCNPDDAIWNQSNNELGNLLLEALTKADLAVQSPVQQIVVRRIRHAYPIYQDGYETSLKFLDDWIHQLPGILTYGRQGLFAHDNTHHALYMAYSAVDCLGPNGDFDWNQWQEFRQIFETHIVED